MHSRYISVLLTALASVNAFGEIAPASVVNDFNARKPSLPWVQPFDVISSDLSPNQVECLQMLYAYMPLPDFTDRSTGYYLDYVVNPALKARNEMPWGNQVPDELFRHFVLPIRVNNEALDKHRPAFYDELKDRVKDLSMKDAILEINHWCHEKVTYQPSDGRTHSPLQSVSSAIGRCGEESTFTVAALRAMGIPARQVYTPRWAHTDDNHAWVEAWADGKWYFLGACEPEPVLNLGWFNAPAARGMLMHARVFGRYNGIEEQLGTLEGTTDINVTPNYAPVDTLSVTVTDKNGKPLANVDVSFRLYNYAELYPIAPRKTDSTGKAQFIGGMGDVVTWVTDGINYNFRQCSVGRDKHVIITLDNDISPDGVFEMNLTPPPAVPADNNVTQKMRDENTMRMTMEDSIRMAYTSTFYTPEKAKAIAEKLGVDPLLLSDILVKSRGNHPTITAFLASCDPDNLTKALQLLSSVSEKDLTDITVEVLSDHLAANPERGDLFAPYIMSPRIDREELTAFRKFFHEVFTDAERDAFKADPSLWEKWVNDNIKATADWYPQQVTMSPESVWRTRNTSSLSRNVFFVAGARAFGIPARIDPVTAKTQWADNNGMWIDVLTDANTDSSKEPQGTLRLTYSPTPSIPDPKYFAHFTLSKINKGNPQLLNYPDFAPMTSIFGAPEALDAGKYMLMSGQRMADGSVLARIKIFDVPADQNITDTLVMRQDSTGIQVIGSFDSESLYTPLETERPRSILSTTGRGYYVLGIVKPNDEPSNHALRDIVASASELQECARPILILNTDMLSAEKMDQAIMSGLPGIVTRGCDINGDIMYKIAEGVNLGSTQLPVFIIADTFNRVVFVSQGYTIGIGQQLVDTLHRLK